jgi:hypothetical protein
MDNLQFEGVDVNLVTSLTEYGFIAAHTGKDYPDEWFVVFQAGQGWYDTGHYRESLLDDLVNGKEWMTEEQVTSMLSSAGLTKEDWLASHFVNKVSDLLMYCGYENIFGTAYYPITEVEAIERYCQVN